MPAKKAAAEKVEKKAKAAKGDKPKRAPTPYILFCSEMRAKVKEENEGAGFGELGKLLGIKWGELDEKGKAPWVKKAAAKKAEIEAAADAGGEESS